MKPLIKQSGLSLVEIMVSLVITLFLVGGIVQVYVGNKGAYKFSDAISRIQENGRFALDSITSDVRMARFFGCVPVQRDKNGDGQLSDDNPHIQNHLNPANYTNGKYDFLNTPSISATVNNGLNGSDSLTLKGVKSGQSSFTSDLASPGSDPINVDSSVSFQANDIVLITNCFTANIFQISSANTATNVTSLTHTTSGTTPGNINLNSCATSGTHCLLDQNDSPYKAGNAAAFSMQVVTYYIGNSDSGSGEPALRRIINNVDNELIEGVEEMQLLFGIDTDADGFPNRYLTSDQVPDMRQVKAIRVALVVRSDRIVMRESSQTYQIFGTDVTATDSRLRQVFSSTIFLRN
jgi:type IV pilus assembly protein PilW